MMSGWFFDSIRRAAFQGEVREHESLARHTYYRIGGPARLLIIPRTPSDLAWISEGIVAEKTPFEVLGLGSNYLVSDEGYDGVVIKLTRLDLGVELLPSGRLRTGASVAVSSLLRRAAQEGWGGLEFLAGVPGSIGGVIAMNAGTHLGEAKDRVRRVSSLQVFGKDAGSVFDYEGDALKFEYRKNLFLPEGSLVTSCEWEIESKDSNDVKAAIDATLARRKASQPVDYPSCGSVFKNPRAHGLHAWQVVDRVGLRGYRIGDAQFAEKHSNFIINLGKAKAVEVRALIELAKLKAKEELGISLEEEVKYLGSFTTSVS
jgi:UDP-N-acetylmuramate dehydrogenase